MVKEIPLSQGKVALVDDHWYPLLIAEKWTFQESRTCVRGEGYAMRYSKGEGKRRRRILMHHCIMQAPLGMLIDHRNGNTLDNQEENLRHATNTQNQANRGLASNNTSGYKGVSYDRQKRRWRAQIKCHGHKHFLGRYRTPEEAAQAYNTAAVRLFGEFAVLNEIAA